MRPSPAIRSRPNAQSPSGTPGGRNRAAVPPLAYSPRYKFSPETARSAGVVPRNVGFSNTARQPYVSSPNPNVVPARPHTAAIPQQSRMRPTQQQTPPPTSPVVHTPGFVMSSQPSAPLSAGHVRSRRPTASSARRPRTARVQRTAPTSYGENHAFSARGRQVWTSPPGSPVGLEPAQVRNVQGGGQAPLVQPNLPSSSVAKRAYLRDRVAAETQYQNVFTLNQGRTPKDPLDQALGGEAGDHKQIVLRRARRPVDVAPTPPVRTGNQWYRLGVRSRGRKSSPAEEGPTSKTVVSAEQFAERKVDQDVQHVATQPPQHVVVYGNPRDFPGGTALLSRKANRQANRITQEELYAERFTIPTAPSTQSPSDASGPVDRDARKSVWWDSNPAAMRDRDRLITRLMSPDCPFWRRASSSSGPRTLARNTVTVESICRYVIGPHRHPSMAQCHLDLMQLRRHPSSRGSRDDIAGQFIGPVDMDQAMRVLDARVDVLLDGVARFLGNTARRKSEQEAPGKCRLFGRRAAVAAAYKQTYIKKPQSFNTVPDSSRIQSARDRYAASQRWLTDGEQRRRASKDSAGSSHAIDIKEDALQLVFGPAVDAAATVGGGADQNATPLPDVACPGHFIGYYLRLLNGDVTVWQNEGMLSAQATSDEKDDSRGPEGRSHTRSIAGALTLSGSLRKADGSLLSKPQSPPKTLPGQYFPLVDAMRFGVTSLGASPEAPPTVQSLQSATTSQHSGTTLLDVRSVVALPHLVPLFCELLGVSPRGETEQTSLVRTLQNHPDVRKLQMTLSRRFLPSSVYLLCARAVYASNLREARSQNRQIGRVPTCIFKFRTFRQLLKTVNSLYRADRDFLLQHTWGGSAGQSQSVAERRTISRAQRNRHMTQVVGASLESLKADMNAAREHQQKLLEEYNSAAAKEARLEKAQSEQNELNRQRAEQLEMTRAIQAAHERDRKAAQVKATALEVCDYLFRTKWCTLMMAVGDCDWQDTYLVEGVRPGEAKRSNFTVGKQPEEKQEEHEQRESDAIVNPLPGRVHDGATMADVLAFVVRLSEDEPDFKDCILLELMYLNAQGLRFWSLADLSRAVLRLRLERVKHMTWALDFIQSEACTLWAPAENAVGSLSADSTELVSPRHAAMTTRHAVSMLTHQDMWKLALLSGAHYCLYAVLRVLVEEQRVFSVTEKELDAHAEVMRRFDLDDKRTALISYGAPRRRPLPPLLQKMLPATAQAFKSWMQHLLRYRVLIRRAINFHWRGGAGSARRRAQRTVHLGKAEFVPGTVRAWEYDFQLDIKRHAEDTALFGSSDLSARNDRYGYARALALVSLPPSKRLRRQGSRYVQPPGGFVSNSLETVEPDPSERRVLGSSGKQALLSGVHWYINDFLVSKLIMELCPWNPKVVFDSIVQLAHLKRKFMCLYDFVECIKCLHWHVVNVFTFLRSPTSSLWHRRNESKKGPWMLVVNLESVRPLFDLAWRSDASLHDTVRNLGSFQFGLIPNDLWVQESPAAVDENNRGEPNEGEDTKLVTAGNPGGGQLVLRKKHNLKYQGGGGEEVAVCMPYDPPRLMRTPSFVSTLMSPPFLLALLRNLPADPREVVGVWGQKSTDEDEEVLGNCLQTALKQVRRPPYKSFAAVLVAVRLLQEAAREAILASLHLDDNLKSRYMLPMDKTKGQIELAVRWVETYVNSGLCHLFANSPYKEPMITQLPAYRHTLAQRVSESRSLLEIRQMMQVMCLDGRDFRTLGEALGNRLLEQVRERFFAWQRRVFLYVVQGPGKILLPERLRMLKFRFTDVVRLFEQAFSASPGNTTLGILNALKKLVTQRSMEATISQRGPEGARSGRDASFSSVQHLFSAVLAVLATHQQAQVDTVLSFFLDEEKCGLLENPREAVHNTERDSVVRLLSAGVMWSGSDALAYLRHLNVWTGVPRLFRSVEETVTAVRRMHGEGMKIMVQMMLLLMHQDTQLIDRHLLELHLRATSRGVYAESRLALEDQSGALEEADGSADQSAGGDSNTWAILGGLQTDTVTLDRGQGGLPGPYKAFSSNYTALYLQKVYGVRSDTLVDGVRAPQVLQGARLPAPCLYPSMVPWGWDESHEDVEVLLGYVMQRIRTRQMQSLRVGWAASERTQPTEQPEDEPDSKGEDHGARSLMQDLGERKSVNIAFSGGQASSSGLDSSSGGSSSSSGTGSSAYDNTSGSGSGSSYTDEESGLSSGGEQDEAQSEFDRDDAVSMYSTYSEAALRYLAREVRLIFLQIGPDALTVLQEFIEERRKASRRKLALKRRVRALRARRRERTIAMRQGSVNPEQAQELNAGVREEVRVEAELREKLQFQRSVVSRLNFKTFEELGQAMYRRRVRSLAVYQDAINQLLQLITVQEGQLFLENAQVTLSHQVLHHLIKHSGGVIPSDLQNELKDMVYEAAQSVAPSVAQEAIVATAPTHVSKEDVVVPLSWTYLHVVYLMREGYRYGSLEQLTQDVSHTFTCLEEQRDNIRKLLIQANRYCSIDKYKTMHARRGDDMLHVHSERKSFAQGGEAPCSHRILPLSSAVHLNTQVIDRLLYVGCHGHRTVQMVDMLCRQGLQFSGVDDLLRYLFANKQPTESFSASDEAIVAVVRYLSSPLCHLFDEAESVDASREEVAYFIDSCHSDMKMVVHFLMYFDQSNLRFRNCSELTEHWKKALKHLKSQKERVYVWLNSPECRIVNRRKWREWIKRDWQQREQDRDPSVLSGEMRKAEVSWADVEAIYRKGQCHFLTENYVKQFQQNGYDFDSLEALIEGLKARSEYLWYMYEQRKLTMSQNYADHEIQGVVQFLSEEECVLFARSRRLGSDENSDSDSDDDVLELTRQDVTQMLRSGGGYVRTLWHLQYLNDQGRQFSSVKHLTAEVLHKQQQLLEAQVVVYTLISHPKSLLIDPRGLPQGTRDRAYWSQIVADLYEISQAGHYVLPVISKMIREHKTHADVDELVHELAQRAVEEARSIIVSGECALVIAHMQSPQFGHLLDGVGAERVVLNKSELSELVTKVGTGHNIVNIMRMLDKEKCVFNSFHEMCVAILGYHDDKKALVRKIGTVLVEYLYHPKVAIFSQRNFSGAKIPTALLASFLEDCSFDLPMMVAVADRVEQILRQKAVLAYAEETQWLDERKKESELVGSDLDKYLLTDFADAIEMMEHVLHTDPELNGRQAALKKDPVRIKALLTEVLSAYGTEEGIKLLLQHKKEKEEAAERKVLAGWVADSPKPVPSDPTVGTPGIADQAEGAADAPIDSDLVLERPLEWTEPIYGQDDDVPAREIKAVMDFLSSPECQLFRDLSSNRVRADAHRLQQLVRERGNGARTVDALRHLNDLGWIFDRFEDLVPTVVVSGLTQIRQKSAWVDFLCSRGCRLWQNPRGAVNVSGVTLATNGVVIGHDALPDIKVLEKRSAEEWNLATEEQRAAYAVVQEALKLQRYNHLAPKHIGMPPPSGDPVRVDVRLMDFMVLLPSTWGFSVLDHLIALNDEGQVTFRSFGALVRCLRVRHERLVRYVDEQKQYLMKIFSNADELIVLFGDRFAKVGVNVKDITRLLFMDKGIGNLLTAQTRKTAGEDGATKRTTYYENDGFPFGACLPGEFVMDLVQEVLDERVRKAEQKGNTLQVQFEDMNDLLVALRRAYITRKSQLRTAVRKTKVRSALSKLKGLIRMKAFRVGGPKKPSIMDRLRRNDPEMKGEEGESGVTNFYVPDKPALISSDKTLVSTGVMMEKVLDEAACMAPRVLDFFMLLDAFLTYYFPVLTDVVHTQYQLKYLIRSQTPPEVRDQFAQDPTALSTQELVAAMKVEQAKEEARKQREREEAEAAMTEGEGGTSPKAEVTTDPETGEKRYKGKSVQRSLTLLGAVPKTEENDAKEPSLSETKGLARSPSMLDNTHFLAAEVTGSWVCDPLEVEVINGVKHMIFRVELEQAVSTLQRFCDRCEPFFSQIQPMLKNLAPFLHILLPFLRNIQALCEGKLPNFLLKFRRRFPDLSKKGLGGAMAPVRMKTADALNLEMIDMDAKERTLHQAKEKERLMRPHSAKLAFHQLRELLTTIRMVIYGVIPQVAAMESFFIRLHFFNSSLHRYMDLLIPFVTSLVTAQLRAKAHITSAQEGDYQIGESTIELLRKISKLKKYFFQVPSYVQQLKEFCKKISPHIRKYAGYVMQIRQLLKSLEEHSDYLMSSTLK